MKLSTYLLPTLLLLASLSTSFAQVSVSGYVVDRTNKTPLMGAHVLLLHSMEKSTISDRQGFFILENIGTKDTILISYMGYTEKLLSFEESTTGIEILLAPFQLNLNEVIIKSTVLGAETFAFDQLKPIDIYINPNAKADALVAINTSVSSTTTDENAAVSFRAASPNQTGYFLNGVPLKKPVKYAQLTNTGTLSIFNTDFLKSTTVFPGNPPLEYGQSTSGTIVLEMADRFSDEWQHTASISLANMGYSARGKLGESTFIGAFTNYQFDDALKVTNPKNFEAINSFKSVDAGILLNSHQKWGSLKFYQYGLWDHYNFQYQHPSYQNGFLQDAIRSISTLQWLQEFYNWQVRVVLGNSFTENRFRFGNLNYTQQNADPYSAVHFSWLKGNNLLKLGYSYWNQQNSIEGHFPAFSYALAPTHPSQYIKQDTSLATHEAYSFIRKLLNKQSFGVGIRVGKVPALNKNLLSYQFNYLWRPIKPFQLKIGVGRYYQVRNQADDKIQYSDQITMDLSYQNGYLAMDQSFYINQMQTGNIIGSETTLTIKPNSKVQFDQSFSIINQINSTQWFTRSFLLYKPLALWSFNLSYQAFKGDTVQIITTAAFQNELAVYQPNLTQLDVNQFNPYQNLSLSINKLYNFRTVNGILFITFNNLLDIKNNSTINYNFDYSQFNNNYLSRRSFYAGVVLNF
jgi:hypothetical protein